MRAQYSAHRYFPDPLGIVTLSNSDFSGNSALHPRLPLRPAKSRRGSLGCAASIKQPDKSEFESANIIYFRGVAAILQHPLRVFIRCNSIPSSCGCRQRNGHFLHRCLSPHSPLSPCPAPDGGSHPFGQREPLDRNSVWDVHIKKRGICKSPEHAKTLSPSTRQRTLVGTDIV